MSTTKKKSTEEVEDFDLDNNGPNWTVVVPILVIMALFAALSFWAW